MVKAEKGYINLWEMFTVYSYSQRGDYFALRSHHGAYLCAENAGGSDILANRVVVQEWEMFRFMPTHRCSESVFQGHFQSWDESYLTTNHMHRHLSANAKQSNAEGTLFRVHVLDW